MKKTGIINRDVSALIAQMGHHDALIIADAGFPTPKGVHYVDLSLKPGSPTVAEVVMMVAQELQVERFHFAAEASEGGAEGVSVILPEAEAVPIPHAEVMQLAAGARGMIRTGECRAYANVVLIAGMTY